LLARRLLEGVVDKSDAVRAAGARLLGQLKLRPAAVAEAFAAQLETLADVCIDVPQLPAYLGALLAAAVQGATLSLMDAVRVLQTHAVEALDTALAFLTALAAAATPADGGVVALADAACAAGLKLKVGWLVGGTSCKRRQATTHCVVRPCCPRAGGPTRRCWRCWRNTRSKSSSRRPRFARSSRYRAAAAAAVVGACIHGGCHIDRHGWQQ
jgi:hypothetical protein